MARNTGTTATIGQRVHQPKMAELIGDSLRRQIVQGDLQEGDSLPSESELMEQFGVSRPTLREAFRILESEALIEIRRGARGGGRVKAPDGAIAARYAGLLLEYRGTQLRDVYGARTEIDAACARMAANGRRSTDLAELERIYDLISETDDVTARIGLHSEFDAAVVRASRNETMIVLSAMVRQIIDRATLASVLENTDKPATRRAYEDAHKAHRRLIDLIRDQDADAAEKHWRNHLELAEKFVMSTGVSGRSVLDLM